MKRNTKPAQNSSTETNEANASNLTVVHNANDGLTEAPKVEENLTPQPKTLKDIVEKNLKVTKCLEKIDTLDRAAKDLDSFNLGSGKLKDALTITDGRGNKFDTSNSVIIEKVVSYLKDEIGNRYTELEAELLLLEAA